MKVIARREKDDIYILEASDTEVHLISEIEGALQGETHSTAIMHRPREGLELPDHKQMAQILRCFLYAIRDHNDFAHVFGILKELLPEKEE